MDIEVLEMVWVPIQLMITLKFSSAGIWIDLSNVIWKVDRGVRVWCGRKWKGNRGGRGCLIFVKQQEVSEFRTGQNYSERHISEEGPHFYERHFWRSAKCAGV